MGSVRNAMVFLSNVWPAMFVVALLVGFPSMTHRISLLSRSSYSTRSYEIRDFLVATPEEGGEVYQDLLGQIVSLIEDVVAPESWTGHGGVATIDTSHAGTLIITQTGENHTAVRQLMRQLRETRAWDGQPFHEYNWRYFRVSHK